MAHYRSMLHTLISNKVQYKLHALADSRRRAPLLPMPTPTASEGVFRGVRGGPLPWALWDDGVGVGAVDRGAVALS